MPLSEFQVREILKAPKQQATIQRAVIHENRLRFHSEISFDRSRTSPYQQTFLTSVQGLLPADKYRTFVSLFQHPVKTVQDTDKIFDSIGKVFDGQNPIYKYDFISAEYLEDWHDYAKSKLNISDRWRTDALEAMRLNINSVVICDLPAEQTSTMPEPYFYFLDICHVIDFSSNGNEFDWIIFRKDDKHIVVIDDKSYTTYYLEKGQDTKKMKFVSQANHDLTYCPAHWFWSQSVSKSDPFIKVSPISTHLQELDWLLFFMISKRVADLYAPFPIVWSYMGECEYQSESNGTYMRCHKGFLQNEAGQDYHDANGNLFPCPKCKDRHFTGAGTKLDVPIPDGSGVGIPAGAPAGFIETSTLSLEYIVKEIERLQKNLYQDITGYGGEPTNDQAVNEKQIVSAFEMRTAILRDLKKNFEIIRQWIDSTLCRLRYADKFISCTIDMGTDFYLYDAASIMELYNIAQDKQMDQSVRDMLLDQYYATKYRNNPDQLAREEIKKHIHPYRHVTESKAVELFEKSIISKENLVIILKFSTFVMRFEREQASLVDFGRNLDFNTRIQRIKEIFNSYAIEAINAGTFQSINPPDSNTIDAGQKARV